MDLIDRQALIEWLKKVGRFMKCCEDTKRMRETIGGIISHIEKLPAVDAVEVVRCKDCKKNPNFSKTSGKHMVWCRKWRCEVKDTDFCSYGERRAEDAG